MIKIKVEKIKPKNSKKENIYVSITIIFLIIFSLILLSFRTKNSNIEKNNEYISIKEMKGSDNITFTSLNLIISDLNTILENKKDISIEYLGDELYYEPFISETLDSHKWFEFKDKQKIYFVGISPNKNLTGDFILEIDTENKKGIIKYNKDFHSFNENMDISKLKDEIKNFKIVKSYTGSDFMKGN